MTAVYGNRKMSTSTPKVGDKMQKSTQADRRELPETQRKTVFKKTPQTADRPLNHVRNAARRLSKATHAEKNDQQANCHLIRFSFFDFRRSASLLSLHYEFERNTHAV